jgi:hypothetical protein
MSDKIKIREILERHVDIQYSMSRNAVEKTLLAIEEIVEAVVNECAAKAKLTDLAQEFLQEIASEAIDKESILKVKEIFDYDST